MTQLFNTWRSDDAQPKKAPRTERKTKSEPPKQRQQQGKRRQPQPPIGGDDNNFGRLMRTLVLWLGLGVVAVILFMVTKAGNTVEPEISYTQFTHYVANDKVSEMLIDVYPLARYELHGTFKSDEQVTNDQTSKTVSSKRFLVKLPPVDGEMRAKWEEKGISYRFNNVEGNWFDSLLGFLPWIAIIVVWLLIARRMQSGGGGGMMGPKGIFSFGKSRAKLLNESAAKVTFDDVAGADEAKQELQEIIEFLKEPAKFQRLGGKIPRGVLLLGPPGTGKTLLARAVAGEAGVPFLSISGAEFVEMFVGVGASRVRDLFEQGKKNAPCIVFIDEIDAVGRHRGAGLGGGHDEREQTLNQLLVEMDGFEQNSGVIIIAATNRPDVLDPALLRPGRFDRQVVVDRPDVRGREGIFKVHTRTIPLAPDVDLATLAKGTPGLAGAEIANLVNEAALLASRRNSTAVSMLDFENAKDKVMMGIERKSLLISEEEKKTTSYHECGHVLVARKIPEADPVHKVTIIPRGRALGLTTYLPIDEKHTYSKEYLEAMITYALGGRAAEKIVFNQVTTGAGNDIERATQLARKMVCEWGMSDRLGPLAFGAKQEEIFLGREIAQHRDYSEATAIAIDEEVRVIIDRGQKRAEQILHDNVDMLHRLAAALLDREILDGDEIDRIMRGETLPAQEKKDPLPVNGTPTTTVTDVEKEEETKK